MEKNKLLDSIDSLYIHEIVYISNMIIRDCETIFNTIPSTEQSYIQVDEGNQYLINSIIVNNSNLRKIFVPKQFKDDKESNLLFKIRIQRGEKLRKIFDFDQFKAIDTSTVRNAIEHFDERIDRLCKNALNNNESIMKYPAIAYNITLSTRSIFVPSPYFLRCYIVDEKLAYIDNKAFNLGDLYTEIKVLRNIAFELLGTKESGGIIISLK